MRMYQKGRIGFLELIFIGLYAIGSLAVFNIADFGEALKPLVDFAWLICVGSVLVVLKGDKKRRMRLTGLEGLALIVAITLPLAAAGNLTGFGIDIGEYLQDTTYKILLWAVSVISCIVVATQD